MRWKRRLAIALAGLAGIGPGPCGGSPSVILVASEQVVVQDHTFVVNVESRAYRTGEAFSYRVTYPSLKLELLSTDLTHGPNDLHIMPSPQAPGEVIIWAANTVINPSLVEPSQGIVLSKLEFRALPTSSNQTAQITIASAKLGTAIAGDPAVIAVPVNPVLGAPLTIQVTTQ